MRLRRAAVPAMVALAAGIAFMPVAATAEDSRQEKILAEFENKTGLKPVQIPDTGGAYLGKTHRGYPVLYTAKAGDVWGRYAARLTMGEIGREVGGLLGFLTGQLQVGHRRCDRQPPRPVALEAHWPAAIGRCRPASGRGRSCPARRR